MDYICMCACRWHGVVSAVALLSSPSDAHAVPDETTRIRKLETFLRLGLSVVGRLKSVYVRTVFSVGPTNKAVVAGIALRPVG